MEFSYYGRLDDVKPRKKLVDSMIDEYIQKQLAKEIDIFKKGMPEFFSALKEEFMADIARIKAGLRKVKKRLDMLGKNKSTPYKDKKERKSKRLKQKNTLLENKEMADIKEKVKKRGIKVD